MYKVHTHRCVFYTQLYTFIELVKIVWKSPVYSDSEPARECMQPQGQQYNTAMYLYKGIVFIGMSHIVLYGGVSINLLLFSQLHQII